MSAVIKAALTAAGLLQMYEQRFEENMLDDITVDLMLEYQDLVFLKEVIPPVGHRLKFLNEYRKLRTPSTATTNNTTDSPFSHVKVEPETKIEQKPEHPHAHECEKTPAKKPRLTENCSSTTNSLNVSMETDLRLDFTKWFALTGANSSGTSILHGSDPVTFARLGELLKDPSTIDRALYNNIPLFQLVLPYLLQRIKMWGGHLFSHDKLTHLLHESMKKLTSNENHEPTALTKMDFFNYLVHTVHPLVLKDSFKILALFPLTLPLVTSTPNPATNQQTFYKVLIPFLRDCLIKWGRKNGPNTLVQENFLFSSPFKMIGTLLFGGSSKSISNKQQQSRIVNSAILRDKLFYAGDDGDEERPLTLSGTIEMVALTEETCNPLFWETVAETSGDGRSTYESDQVLLLANLYGNALNTEFEGHIKFISDLCSALIVVIVPDDDDDDEEACVPNLVDHVKAHFPQFGNTRVFTITVFPKERMRRENLEDSISIPKSRFTSRLSQEKIHNIFRKAVQTPKKNPPSWLITRDPDSKTPATHYNEDLKNLYFAEEIWTHDSMMLLKKVQNHPQACHSLQFYNKVPNGNNGSCDEALRLVNSIFNNECSAKNVRLKVLHHFLRILKQPTEIQQKSIAHLESALCQTTNNGQALTLRMETIFRELAAIYESLVQSGPSIENDRMAQNYVTSVPKNVARYFLEGGPIELFDGDKDTMNSNWLKDVFQNVCDLHPNLRIFVVSMLGIQSSGKSTLLNALFKCRFPVSAGRCTKGLFIQLVFLENDYAQQKGFDAILVIDTEGLESPEKLNERSKALERDRKMATFVSSISNLSILNVLGESLTDISGILQIVVIALSRLKNVGLQPSSLMLVQHSNEKNSVNRERTFRTFAESVATTINLVKKNPQEFGPYNASTMESWERSLGSRELVCEFDAFKGGQGGGGVGAPPSRKYHEDVRDLYQRIMDQGSKTKPYSFDLWQDRILETYKCISEYSKKDFAFRFKDILEVQDFYQRAGKISTVQQKLSQAMKDHVDDLKMELTALLDDPEYVGITVSQGTKSEMEECIYSKTLEYFERCTRPLIPQEEENYRRDSSFVEVCFDDPPRLALTNGEQIDDPPATGCSKCTLAIELFNKLKEEIKESRHEPGILKTIQDYQTRLVDSARKSLATHFRMEVLNRHSSSEIGKLIKTHLKQRLVRVDPVTGKEFDDVSKRTNLKIAQKQEFKKLYRIVNRNLGVRYEPKEGFQRIIFDDVIMDLEDALDPAIINKLEKQNLGEEPVLFSPGFLDDINIRMLIQSCISISPLTLGQKNELIGKLKTLSKTALQDKKYYEKDEGLAFLLKTEVRDLIFDFEVKYGADFEKPLIIWEKVLQICLTKMYQREREWYYRNSPAQMFALLQKEYETVTNRILKDGWNIHVAGVLCGKFLVRLTKKIAQMSAEKEFQNRASDSKSIEYARLTYFTELAQEVLNENFEGALKHFREPTKSLKQWTKKKLFELSKDRRIQDFDAIFDFLMKSTQRQIENATTVQQIRDVERHLFKQTQGVFRTDIDIDLTNFDEAHKSFDVFKAAVLAQFIPENMLAVRNAVQFQKESGTILQTKVGCTAHCKFCGAICWLDAGHERNSDDTRRHITSHQPRGLKLGEQADSCELDSTTCYEIPDDTEFEHGRRKKRWRDLKEAYSGWDFRRTANSDFDALMCWFFVNLNEHLAKEHWALKPLNAIQIDRLIRDKQLPNLNSILHAIKIKIREQE